MTAYNNDTLDCCMTDLFVFYYFNNQWIMFQGWQRERGARVALGPVKKNDGAP